MKKKGDYKVWTEFYTHLYRKIKDRTTKTSLISLRDQGCACDGLTYKIHFVRGPELIVEVIKGSRPEGLHTCTEILKG